MRPRILPHVAIVLAMVALALPALAQQANAPHLINQEGLLLDQFGFPVDTGEQTQLMTFRLYAAADAL